MGRLFCLPCWRLYRLPLEVIDTMKNLIIQRLREPSTWAGLSALAVLFGLPPGTVEAVGQIVGGAAAIAAIILAENRTK